MVTKHATYSNYDEFELYLLVELFKAIANKIRAYSPVWPLKSQKLDLDLFFNNFETVRRI